MVPSCPCRCAPDCSRRDPYLVSPFPLSSPGSPASSESSETVFAGCTFLNPSSLKVGEGRLPLPVHLDLREEAHGDQTPEGRAVGGHSPPFSSPLQRELTATLLWCH